MKKILTIITLAFLLAGTGCKHPTLETGSHYAADYNFFAADLTFKTLYSSMDAVFKFESDNRDSLWKVSPDIKHSLDKIRPEAATVAAPQAAVTEQP